MFRSGFGNRARRADGRRHTERVPEAVADERGVERAKAERRRDEKVGASHALATRRAYAADWAGFERWCVRLSTPAQPFPSLPTDDVTLATWVGALDDLALSTVRRKLSAVRLVHARMGCPLPASLPATTAAVRGHAREQAEREPRRQTAATAERLVRMLDTLAGDSPLVLRNRALLLVGFDAALRRSELVGIDRRHLAPTDTGYTIRLPRSKTDQDGSQRARVAIVRQRDPRYCPVAALDTWLAVHDPAVEPVFVSLVVGRHVAEAGTRRLSAKAVERVVKQTAKAAGFDGPFAGHSLRRGQITSAIERAVPLDRVQAHARHADIGSTLGYVETRDAVDNHPGVALGREDRIDDEPPVPQVPEDGAPRGDR